MNRPEQATVTAQIAALQRMTVGQLRQKWKELYSGEETRSFNRAYLWRRLAWRADNLKRSICRRVPSDAEDL